MQEHVKEHLLKTFPTIEFKGKKYECSDAIEKAEKENDPYCVCGVFLALFNSLYGGYKLEIHGEYIGEAYTETYGYCLLIKDLVPEAYPFYMGHILIHMPDKEFLDLDKLKGIETDTYKRFKIALELLEKAKDFGEEAENDIKFAKEFIDFYERGSNHSGGTVNTGSTSTSGGCYIATCVYGSYDCPQVWRLRRYRDYYLKNHWWGRLFIRIYYCISPKLVAIFGNNKLFTKYWKKYLDKKMESLKNKGYICEPYFDRQ